MKYSNTVSDMALKYDGIYRPKSLFAPYVKQFLVANTTISIKKRASICFPPNPRKDKSEKIRVHCAAVCTSSGPSITIYPITTKNTGINHPRKVDKPTIQEAYFGQTETAYTVWSPLCLKKNCKARKHFTGLHFNVRYLSASQGMKLAPTVYRESPVHIESHYGIF